MLAPVNTAGINVPIYMVAQHSSIGWGQNAFYPNQEGTFFGNIFTTNGAGTIGSQVGVEFQSAGAFTAHLDSVTW